MDTPNNIQAHVIQQILTIGKKHFMISMASQGGKSLCYQIPALQKDGMTIIFVPSLALINDLLAYFATRGIEAVSINSLNDSEWVSVVIKMLMGSPKFFLWTPEMANTNDLLRKIIEFLIEENKINYIVVDEAHYIEAMNEVTNPGKDLKASREQHFGIIKSLRKFSQEVTWIALTTASKEYKDELSEKLGMTDVHFISSHVTRKNIFYRVYDSEATSVDLAKSILEKYKNASASGIIFCNSVNQIENVRNKLNRNGISAIQYYKDIHQSNIEDWAAGKYQVIVAKGESFGFGLNHFIPTSIRFVIHRYVPGNLHAYYHESGRVGNDGAKSFAYIIKDGQINDEFSGYFEQVCRHKTLANFFGKTTDPCGNMCDVCAPTDFH